MYIAREKYKTNVVEYILYMFNIEDVIRSNKFDMELLEKNINSKYNISGQKLNEVRGWYNDLTVQMKKEDLIETGHLSSIKELIFKLNDLHIVLLNTTDEERYIEIYHWATDIIRELKNKMNHPELTEIEVCLNGLYAMMLLKMKGLEISTETLEAMGIFSQMMRYLSKNYHKRFIVV